jgi:septum formation protein
MEIVLASRSPRRRELLCRFVEAFRIVPPEVDESSIAEPDPERFALESAVLKAEAVAASFPEAIVIGADTIVTIDGRNLGKPAGRDEARAMLELLSGRTHRVITGVAVVHKASDRRIVESETTAVTFRPLSPEIIAAYLDRDDFQDKAGAYAIQDIGGKFVASVDGDYDNVVGFPVSRVASMLVAMLSPGSRPAPI